jgi:hypothetical protein
VLAVQATPTPVSQVAGVSELPRTGAPASGGAGDALLALGVVLLFGGGALLATARRRS